MAYTARTMKDILENYQLKRSENKKKLKERRMKLYQTYPELAEIEKQMGHIGAEISKSILTSPQHGEAMLNELKHTLDMLKTEKAKFFIENNIPMDSLEVHYDCKKCMDTGYTQDKRRCVCFNQQLIDLAYEMSNIKKQLHHQNFDHFNLSIFSNEPNESTGISQQENMAHLLSEAESFIQNFPKGENLFFYGSSGLGKTFLCNCMAKALIDKGFSVIYQTPFNIIQILEKKQFSDKSNPLVLAAYNQLFHCDLLIMDDLGTETANTFTISEFYNIINTRILNEKSTIISTNIKLSEIASFYNDRIDSRIKGHYQLFKFFGPDVRWEH